MNISLAKSKDFSAYLQIKKEFLKEYKLPDMTEKQIKKEFLEYLKCGIVLALENQEVVGYLSGEIEDNTYWKVGYISEVFVKKAWRGKGISTKLKDKFLGILRNKKIKKCKIDVNPDNPALEVYKSWGFKIDKYRLSLKL